MIKDDVENVDVHELEADEEAILSESPEKETNSNIHEEVYAKSLASKLVTESKDDDKVIGEGIEETDKESEEKDKVEEDDVKETEAKPENPTVKRET